MAKQINIVSAENGFIVRSKGKTLVFESPEALLEFVKEFSKKEEPQKT